MEEVRDARLVRRLWAYVRPYRAAFRALALTAPLVELLGLAQPYLLKLAVDRGVVARNPTALDRVALVFLGILAAQYAAGWALQSLGASVAQRSLADLRVALFAHLQRLPMRFFDAHPVGEAIARLTSDVDVLQDLLAAGALTIACDVLRVAGVVAVMCWLDVRLAATSLVLLPAVVGVMLVARRLARRLYRAARERLAAVGATAQETFAGATVIALSRAEARVAAEMDALDATHRDLVARGNALEVRLLAFVEAIAGVAVALVLLEGTRLHARGLAELGTLVAFVGYTQQLFAPIRDFSAKYSIVQAAMAAAERIFALLDVPAEPAAAPAAPPAGAGTIAFERVWFAYREDEWVLRNVSFRIAAGEQIAVVGGSGSGKTTLVRLLERFYEPQRGRVLVDGVDVRDWDPAALRRRIAVVLQDVFLFSGSVTENVTLGHPDIDAGAVAAALDAVEATDAVARLGGVEAPVGARGQRLAAGERQLLAFARALAHDPAILVLDEATSSVDGETEAVVQTALQRLLAGRTALVIAHRLATVERADRILVLQDGELREQGTHATLLARGGVYARLRALQQGAGVPADVAREAV